jgi:putative spermidine/putrescine transport system substrate-binding protein
MMTTRFRFASLALAALIGIAATGPAAAQEKKTLTVSMWGFNGDKLEAFLFKPFKEKYGVDIVLETGNAADRLNKVKIRGGGVDLIYLSDVFSEVGLQDKLFETIDPAKVPNLKEIYPIAKAPQGEGFGPAYTIGRYGIVYDSAKVKPVTAWGDLWRDDLKKKISLPGFNTTAGPLIVLVAAERRKADAYAAPDAAFASLAEIKPNLVKTYNTGSELVNLFSTGEVAAAAVQDFVFPQLKAAIPTAAWADLGDGAFSTFNTVNVVVGSKNKDLALAFINHHLSAEVQKNLAVAGTDAPSNRTVVLTPEQAAPWTYGEATVKALRRIDYARLNAAKADWQDRWNDIFGR